MILATNNGVLDLENFEPKFTVVPLNDISGGCTLELE